MRNVKLKTIMLVYSLLLTTVLTACGANQSTDVKSSEEIIIGEAVDNEVKVTDKIVDSEDDIAAENISSEITEEEGETDNSEKLSNENILSSYQEILKAAPAINGEHDELYDASFDYDQNYELFGNHYELFALYDLNQDEIPELIAFSTVNFRWTNVSIYTYEEGKVVLVKNQFNAEANNTFEQVSTANGAYITYICKDNHIHSVWHGTNPIGEEVEENYAYVLAGTSIELVDCAISEGENTISLFEIVKENTEENVDAMIP